MTQRPTRLAPGSILDTLPMGRDALSVRRRVEAMERVMEGLFVIPGTNRKVGLDVILDVIPFAGSTIAAAVGGWMAWEARNIGMSKVQMARMFGNVGVDWALGMIPFVGAQPAHHQAASRQASPLDRHARPLSACRSKRRA
jgi:hypothetical protein